MHLAATRLASPEFHLNAETLQQANYRASGLGQQRVVITGYEKRSAHAATPQNAFVSIKEPNDIPLETNCLLQLRPSARCFHPSRRGKTFPADRRCQAHRIRLL